MILNYCRERYQEIENSGNYVILVGYLNYDLLAENDHPFNLPLYEIKNVIELGELSSFIMVTRDDIKQEEDEIPVELVAEKPKKKKKAEGEEGAEGEEPIEGEEQKEGEAEPEPESEEENSSQFDVSDNRTLDEVVNWLMGLGFIPSFCTACYREGRTGDRFMALCKNKQIQNCCHPNALLTLKEYLMDYASEETKKIGEELISREINNIPNPKAKDVCINKLDLISEGQRDFRF